MVPIAPEPGKLELVLRISDLFKGIFVINKFFFRVEYCLHPSVKWTFKLMKIKFEVSSLFLTYVLSTTLSFFCVEFFVFEQNVKPYYSIRFNFPGN